MDLGELDDLCKIECRKYYNDFKICLINNPFGVINNGIIEDAVVELNVNIGTIIFNAFLKDNYLAKEKMVFMSSKIDYYRDITLLYAKRFGTVLIKQ